MKDVLLFVLLGLQLPAIIRTGCTGRLLDDCTHIDAALIGQPAALRAAG